MIEEEAKKKAPAKAPAKPVEKPDSYEVIEPEIEHTHSDKMVHAMSNDKDFKAKYKERWRKIANALAHVHTWHERTKRDR